MRALARPVRRTLTLTAVIALGAPVGAQAASGAFTCEASVLRGQLLSAPAFEPLVVGRGGTCTSAVKGIGNLAQPVPAPATLDAVNASTFLKGPAGRPDLQQALAAGGVTNLRVGSLASLGLALPADVPLPAGLDAIAVDLSSLAALFPLLTLPTQITVDVQAAVRDLLRLPTSDLVRVGAAVAYAGVVCKPTGPERFGVAQVAEVSVLGQTLPVDTLLQQGIVDTQSIDLGQIDVTTLATPAFIDTLLPELRPAVLAAVQDLIAQTLGALAPVSVPIELAQVRLAPGAQSTTGDVLTQTALSLRVSALGTPVTDLIVGEAKAGSAGVDCTPPVVAPALPAPVATPASAALACTKRPLVLEDVVRRGDRVTITGAADKRLVGRFVRIVFEGDGSTAGRALVAPDGSFKTTAALPSLRLRNSNRARYQAVMGRLKSLNLKLARRMVVERLAAKGGRVTIVGRVTRPLANPASTITLTRRVSCRRSEVVKRFKPRADGTFRVTVAAPKGQTAAVYRLGTLVRKTANNPKRFPTFTLPRGVDLTR